MRCYIHTEPDGSKHIIPGDCNLWNEFHMQGDLTDREFIKQHCTCQPTTYHQYEKELFNKKQAELRQKIEYLEFRIKQLTEYIEANQKLNQNE